ncbi:MAG: 50S ribosomal protein L34e [Candidatus Aenigmarchaeota archaeon ex4484_52]|nr:MAG: 50S ribosomal protein L34e [Candidatus Aenigmarchaeota archaeon ex4484_52]
MEPRFRSRSQKRIKTKIPGGNIVLHFRKRKISTAKCAICKNKLAGIARARQKKLKKLPKTKKTVSRIYGGYLCPKCLKHKIKQDYFNLSDITKDV